MPGGVRKPQCYRTACVCVCGGGGEGVRVCGSRVCVCAREKDPRGSGVDGGLKALALCVAKVLALSVAKALALR